MKKVNVLLLSALIATITTGCGGNGETSSSISSRVSSGIFVQEKNIPKTQKHNETNKIFFRFINPPKNKNYKPKPSSTPIEIFIH